MGTIQKIEAAAQSIVNICRQDRPTKTDKQKLLKLHAEILRNVENLIECQVCGSITDLVVTMTLEQVTANVCKACGIKSLETGKIQKQTSRSKSSQSYKKKGLAASSKRTASVAVSSKPPQLDTAAFHEMVEEKTGLKKTDVKRLHKMINEIASPMNLENTISYMQREVAVAKMRIDTSALGKAVKLLIDN